MSFPKRLLADHETLVLVLRPHWIVLVWSSAVSVLVVLALAYALPRIPHAEGRSLQWTALAAGALILLVFPLPRLARWWTSYFVVTSDRVIRREGVIARSSMEIPLEAINDVRFQQSILERMIGAGDLVIESAGEFGSETFSDVRHPEEVQKTIYEQGELNQRRMQGGGAYSPAEEIARLAELRDRGILTAEEFEAQKQKVLGT